MRRKTGIIAILIIISAAALFLYSIELIPLWEFIIASTGSLILVSINLLESLKLKESEAKSLIKKAEDLYKNKEIKAAQLTFTEALKLYPDSYEAYLGIAQCYRILMQNDEAIKNYKKAIHLNPNAYQTYFFYAMANLQANNPEEALVALGKIEELKPDFEDGYYLMGQIYEKKKDYDKAVIYYQKYIDRNYEGKMKEEIERRIDDIKQKNSSPLLSEIKIS